MTFDSPPSAGGFGGSVCANHATNPATAICERCGDFICGYCLRPSDTGQTYCPRCATASGPTRSTEALAWEVPADNGGNFVAFFKTAKDSLMAPWNGFFTTVDPQGGYGRPTLYFLICTGFQLIGSFASSAAQFTSGDEAERAVMTDLLDKANTIPGLEGAGLPMLLGGGFVSFFLMLGMIVAMQFVVAGLVHLSCTVVGANAGGYQGTYRMLAYMGVSQLLGGLLGILTFVVGVWHPFLYLGMSMITGIVSMILGLYVLMLWVIAIRDVHQVTTGRAVGAMAAYIGFTLLFVCGCAALVLTTVGFAGAGL